MDRIDNMGRRWIRSPWKFNVTYREDQNSKKEYHLEAFIIDSLAPEVYIRHPLHNKPKLTATRDSLEGLVGYLLTQVIWLHDCKLDNPNVSDIITSQISDSDIGKKHQLSKEEMRRFYDLFRKESPTTKKEYYQQSSY